MSFFFYLFTWAINLWHRKFVIADASLQCLSTINMILSDEDKIWIKSLYLKGYTAKRLTDAFPEKSWTKRGVNSAFHASSAVFLRLSAPVYGSSWNISDASPYK